MAEQVAHRVGLDRKSELAKAGPNHHRNRIFFAGWAEGFCEVKERVDQVERVGPARHLCRQGEVGRVGYGAIGVGRASQVDELLDSPTLETTLCGEQAQFARRIGLDRNALVRCRHGPVFQAVEVGLGGNWGRDRSVGLV